MSRIRLLKRLIPKLLGPAALVWVKKMYYARAVKSFWEPDIEPIKCLVKPGDIVLDIGANVGWYTTILAKLVGPRGTVYGIEPVPETFQLLSAVTEGLRLRNAELIRCAISEKDGSALMEVPLYEYGAENFYQARIIDNRMESRLRQHEVDLRSLDSLFLEIAKDITFIKCDVEGHELAVIKGARRILLRSRPAWLIEVSGNPDDEGSPSRELFNCLHSQNYAAYWFDGETLRKRSAGDRAINYFFLQSSHIAELGSLRCDGSA